MANITKIIKKSFFALMISVSLVAMCACGEIIMPTAEALTVGDDNKTGLGIGVDSSFNDLINAYGEYRIDIVNEDGTYAPYVIPQKEKEAEYTTEDIRLVISAFFVDDTPYDTVDLIEMTGTDAASLNDYISSNEYLAAHTVVYRYVIFTVQDNVITDIENNYLDYNVEL